MAPMYAVCSHIQEGNCDIGKIFYARNRETTCAVRRAPIVVRNQQADVHNEAVRQRGAVPLRPHCLTASLCILRLALCAGAALALPFPRVHRIRWDKPFAEADGLANLERLVT
jgi:hypothetical protein